MQLFMYKCIIPESHSLFVEKRCPPVIEGEEKDLSREDNRQRGKKASSVFNMVRK